MQGTGVTTAEIETIKSNLAFVFSNGKNIFYEKGILEEYHATEALHTCVNFQGLLKSIRMRLVSSAFIESAVEIDGENLKYLKVAQTVHTLFKVTFVSFHCTVFQRGS